MRFLIIGAGALGGYFGGMLLKGGADVTFLVRPRRAAQLAERGLVITAPEGDFATPVRSVRAGALDGRYDVVLLACKSYDLDAAMTDFAPGLAADGAVLPLLNGINHIDSLRERLGARRVLGGMTTVRAEMQPGGEIRRDPATPGQTAFGELGGAPSARCEAIRLALAAGGIPSTVSGDILAEMWAKFCGFCAIAAVATLTRGRAGEVAAAAAGAGFVAATYAECAGVGATEGHPPPPLIRDIVLGLFSRPGSLYHPSILDDLEQGRPTEGEHTVGDLVRRADRHRLEVPILRAALCNLQIHELRRQPRD